MRETLTKQEWLVMEAIWDHGPMFLAEIMERLNQRTNWAQTTYATYLKRLVNDGYLTYETIDRRRCYRAAVSREDCMVQESRSLMSRMTTASKKLFVTNMIKEGSLTEEDHDELKKMIEDLERGTSGEVDANGKGEES